MGRHYPWDTNGILTHGGSVSVGPMMGAIYDRASPQFLGGSSVKELHMCLTRKLTFGKNQIASR